MSAPADDPLAVASARTWVEVDDRAGVRTIRLNRPDKINALNAAMMSRIAMAIREAGPVGSHTIVLSGAGPRGFCAGADIAEFAQGEAQLAGQEHALVSMIAAFAESPLPILLLAHGRALGAGATLLSLADLVIAADDLSYGFPEIRFGMYPAIVHGALMYKLSAAQASQLSFSGRTLAVQETVSLGLVTQVVPRAEFDEASGRWLKYYLDRQTSLTIGKRAWCQDGAGHRLSQRVQSLAPLMLENYADPAVRMMIDQVLGPRQSG